MTKKPAESRSRKYTTQHCEDAVVSAILEYRGNKETDRAGIIDNMDNSMYDSFGIDSLDREELISDLSDALGMSPTLITGGAVTPDTMTPRELAIEVQNALREEGRLLEQTATHVPAKPRTKSRNR